MFSYLLTIVLCLFQHANSVRRCADEYQTEHVERRGRRFSAGFRVPSWEVSYNRQARAGSFFARDNIHNFIRWCNELGVLDCLMFETEDLVSRKNEKHVILCLLEIARRGAKFGMAAPILVQFEQQIDREIAREEAGGGDTAGDQEPPAIMVYGPSQQVVTNDLKSLDEMVSTAHQAAAVGRGLQENNSQSTSRVDWQTPWRNIGLEH